MGPMAAGGLVGVCTEVAEIRAAACGPHRSCLAWEGREGQRESGGRSAVGRRGGEWVRILVHATGLILASIGLDLLTEDGLCKVHVSENTRSINRGEHFNGDRID